MSKPFEEADLSAIKTVSIASRASKVTVDDIVDPRDGQAVDRDRLLGMFPDILAAKALKAVAEELRRKRASGREIVWLVGAHTIKVGLSGYLQALIESGYITCLATTGSAVIHDLELSFFGKTSEDVAAELPAGRFGMAEETSQHFNAAVAHADEKGIGFGAGVGAYVEAGDAPHARISVFAAAHRAGVPVTTHVAFGTDITHQHGTFPAEAAARCTMRDFRVLTNRVGRMFDAGAIVVFGSAVILPEVFLKAVSICYNLGQRPRDVTAASFDMIQHYRVRENVLMRPFAGQARAYAITGHHEIMLPLLYSLLA